MRALIEVQQPATGPAWMVKVKIQEVVSNMVNLWHIHNYTKNIWIKTYEKQMWGWQTSYLFIYWDEHPQASPILWTRVCQPGSWPVYIYFFNNIKYDIICICVAASDLPFLFGKMIQLDQHFFNKAASLPKTKIGSQKYGFGGCFPFRSDVTAISLGGFHWFSGGPDLPNKELAYHLYTWNWYHLVI